MNTKSVGVVLFNLGGPGDLSEVEPFLVKLFSDREIIELPGGASLQPLMARLIAKMRGKSVRENYMRIGGGSPQLRLTRAQAKALEHRLNELGGRDFRFTVTIAMRYSSPTSAETLGELGAADVRNLVTLTLFPHYSKATTGSSRHEFDRTLAEPRFSRLSFDVTHIEHYADNPGYLEAMTATARDAYHRIPEARRAGTVILFSAHGLPQKFIDEGDPYVRHIEATRQGILSRLNVPNRQLLAYQSRTGPVKWLGPGTEETIEELGREAILTAWIELWMPKERILEAYLNVVELGPGVFGADAAARVYFDREAGAMTREQTALLAATLPAPLSRNPAASTPALRARQRMILSRMGRWYEGPSLAEEEAIAEQPHAPERRPSEPIGLEALEDSARADPVLADTLPLDSGAVTGEDRAPAEDAPSTVPADSATERS